MLALSSSALAFQAPMMQAPVMPRVQAPAMSAADGMYVRWGRTLRLSDEWQQLPGPILSL